MKTYFIDFTIQLSDGPDVFSQTLSLVARNIDFATTLLENDLIFLAGTLSADYHLVYDLTKIYSYGE